MRRSLGGWLLYGLAVVGLIVIIALWMLAQPLPETVPPTLTPTLTPTSTATPTPTTTPTPTPTPTVTPSPTPACTETTGRVEQHTYASQTTGNEETYRIYLPPCYDYAGQAGAEQAGQAGAEQAGQASAEQAGQVDAGQSNRHYPVLYLLHGWPYDDAHWDSLGADEAADVGIQADVLPPFIIVMPKGSEVPYIRTSGGDRSFEGQIVNDLIPHVDATYRTLSEREGRAIGGISRGGVWALEIGFLYPNLFAVVGAHSPALSVNLAPQVYSPFYLLDGPSVGMLRIYLDAGDTDWARETTQALHKALDEQSIANEFVVHPGGHTNGLWEANIVEYLAFYTAGW